MAWSRFPPEASASWRQPKRQQAAAEMSSLQQLMTAEGTVIMPAKAERDQAQQSPDSLITLPISMNPCGLSDATCFESLPAVCKRDKILLARDLKRTGEGLPGPDPTDHRAESAC
jgi:hypothetical protein